MDLDINLLVKKNNYYKIERLFQQGRRMTVFLGVLAVLFLAALFLMQQNLKQKLDVLAAEKVELEEDLASKRDTESKIRLLNNKMVAMKTVVDQSPDYGAYYDRLSKFLPKDSTEGTLTKISFSQPNFVVIELEFPDILSLTKFLSTVESKEFLVEFDSVKLSNIIFSNTIEALTLKVSLEYANEAQDK